MPYEIKMFDKPAIMEPCLQVLYDAGWTDAQVRSAKAELLRLFELLNTAEPEEVVNLIHHANSDLADMWNMYDHALRVSRLSEVALSTEEAGRLYQWCTFEKGEIWLVEGWGTIPIEVLIVLEPYAGSGPLAYTVKLQRIIP